MDDGKGQRRIAVVGAGISGLSAAWLLHRSGAQVTLFEREAVCGGHSLTDDSPGFPVDLGFQVFNLTTYPHLVGLLEALGVDSEESEMSFSLSLDKGALEWASHGLGTVFAQRENLWKLSFWRMVYDVIRFGQQAPKVLEPKHATAFKGMSMGEYLKKHNYSRAFQYNYLLPMCAAVWSVPNSLVFAFPAEMLIRFWHNHHLLDLLQRPLWRVVKNRSRTYVNAIVSDLEDVWINTEVVSVVPGTEASQPTIHLANGIKQEFDAVILATHSDTSLKLLGKHAPKGAREVLAAIPYGNNDVWVHSDKALMPCRQEAWASWNFLGKSSGQDDAAVCVTYWLNRLQSLPPGAQDVFVTLNPLAPPAADKVHRRLTLAHPVLSRAAYEAQSKLPGVQGEGGLYYAGAWSGYGFHEDGLKAGIATAELLGARVPWTPRATSPKTGLIDALCQRLFNRFARMAIKTGYLRLILPSGHELSYGSPNPPSPSPDTKWRGLPQQHATVRVLNSAFFRKIITRHDTGLGEAYMDGDFEVVGDLGSLLAVITANAVNIQDNRGALGIANWVGDKLLLLAHLARPNTLSGSRRNIEQHYDAGNEMYRQFLDPSMTYSGAIHQPGDTLEEAQMRKLDALIELAQLQPGDDVLEIGCGWGSLAMRAVKKVGCKWTGITLSRAQLEEATKRVKAAGLEDSITLLLCDYRDLPRRGSYDKVISCEMIEAVGQENLATYFRAIGSALRIGGLAVLQAISEPDDRYEAYCASSDFIREHVFPGGHLPCMAAMATAARGTGLAMTTSRDIGPDYAITLRAWRAAWEERRAEVLDLGYSDRFWRKYRFYFAYCEAAFDAKYIHNFQVAWLKAGEGQAEDEMVNGPVAASEPGDPLTQVLLAVYFFLAGVAVSQSRRLWVMPLTSVVYLSLVNVTAAVVASLSKISPRLGKLGAEGQAWLSVDIVHMFHSVLVFLGACLHVVQHPRAWLGTSLSQQSHPLPDLLVCTSAGFFGYQLFTLVHQRLYKRVHRVLLHYTVLLVLFGVAAYKAEHTSLLACSLVSELPTVLYLAGKIQGLLGIHSNNPLRRLQLLTAELPSTILLRLLPHAFMTAVIAFNSAAFSNLAFYTFAMAAAVYINAMNVKRVLALLQMATRPKAHAA